MALKFWSVHSGSCNSIWSLGIRASGKRSFNSLYRWGICLFRHISAGVLMRSSVGYFALFLCFQAWKKSFRSTLTSQLDQEGTKSFPRASFAFCHSVATYPRRKFFHPISPWWCSALWSIGSTYGSSNLAPAAFFIICLRTFCTGSAVSGSSRNVHVCSQAAFAPTLCKSGHSSTWSSSS